MYLFHHMGMSNAGNMFNRTPECCNESKHSMVDIQLYKSANINTHVSNVKHKRMSSNRIVSGWLQGLKCVFATLDNRGVLISK